MGSHADIALLALYAVGVWWASTWVILVALGRGEATYRWSMLAAILIACGALVVIVATRGSTTLAAAAIAFTAAIAVWGAFEIALLMGYLVGPRREPCPHDVTGWRRFSVSFQALAHHELGLAVTALLLFWLVGSGPNPVAAHIFALLWVMRLSTKLNIFLGVANIAEEFMPRRISYLKTYFRRAPMNALFPVTVTATTVGVVVFVLVALDAQATPFESAAATLLATFAALAVLEHWMLVLPIPSTALWPVGTIDQDETKAGSHLQRHLSPVRAGKR
jgi:putative photosynthetic complex assembly protein 2